MRCCCPAPTSLHQTSRETRKVLSESIAPGMSSLRSTCKIESGSAISPGTTAELYRRYVCWAIRFLCELSRRFPGRASLYHLRAGRSCKPIRHSSEDGNRTTRRGAGPCALSELLLRHCQQSHCGFA
ncbi:hypothetical protein PLICRDRAFT_183028 [Plicaturopsis crispa FD-325 SS-3]|nr:hypothetical protein PLICRDRAFT_183028 [Plicaturopsis crispa FD-325 SS-3]